MSALHVLAQQELLRFNTLVVLSGTTLLGAAAGVVGTFAYLRKRAMMGDALSHATLPGVAAAFLLTATKSLTALMAGAAVTGILGVVAVIGISRLPRIKEDAAIGIVLSVFFAVGMLLVGIGKSLGMADISGLNDFIYGSAAAMLRRDALLIAAVAIGVIAACVVFYKEFRVVCFDQEYAAVQGWPVVRIDLLMMALVVVTTVIGLQAVGLLLVVALLIIPPAAARFWTDSLGRMIACAGAIGAASGLAGSIISAHYSRMPTGGIIVICGGVLFFLSMLLAPHRGVLAGLIRELSLRRTVAWQHLLRALAEHEERFADGARMERRELLACRSWSARQLDRVIGRAIRADAVATGLPDKVGLTAAGRVEARRVLRNHRLWELYLIRHADVAPALVDRDADEIEHVLSNEIIHDLEAALAEETPIPPSPHALEGPA